MTHGRAEIHELLLANQLHPSRALGQNFVADGNTVRRIVRLAGIAPGRRVVEIGAGLGSLTLALVEAGATVTAVEIDRFVVPVLRDQVESLGVRVVEADALTVDWGELLGEDPAGEPWALVANLPYNVAVPLVVRVLEEAPQVSSLLVMVQREVGERLAAGPGDDSYGAVSVKVAYWATASVVGRVSASVFIPRPRVESVLVRLDRRSDREVRTEEVVTVPATPVTTGSSPWCGGASPTAARCSGAHWRASSSPRLSRPPASDPPPGPRSWASPSGSGWRRGRRGVAPPDPPRSPGQPERPMSSGAPVRLTAPAKLTVSLRVTGTRPDGYHLLEVGDGHPRPGRHPGGERGRRLGHRRRRSEGAAPGGGSLRGDRWGGSRA